MAQLSPSEMAAVYRKMLEAVMHDSRKLPKGSSNLKKLEERQRNQNDETEECSMVDQVAKDLGIHIVMEKEKKESILRLISQISCQRTCQLNLCLSNLINMMLCCVGAH
ncbi:hypothetical protein C5167_022679 [Papaver somniferum]|uniref:Uncharacterized protein n=1 Tax=Papaver somniferum TaxID=3469 RepID=A0A4Y7JMC6_PAPSO|nr:uncharacterized protein LOC113277476 [Papaver somniferum]RZC60928.1 hypothetical protein C5167_022679 [Papaver somniferum]